MNSPSNSPPNSLLPNLLPAFLEAWNSPALEVLKAYLREERESCKERLLHLSPLTSQAEILSLQGRCSLASEILAPDFRERAQQKVKQLCQTKN